MQGNGSSTRIIPATAASVHGMTTDTLRAVEEAAALTRSADVDHENSAPELQAAVPAPSRTEPASKPSRTRHMWHRSKSLMPQTPSPTAAAVPGDAGRESAEMGTDGAVVRLEVAESPRRPGDVQFAKAPAPAVEFAVCDSALGP